MELKKNIHELMKIHWSISGSYCQRKCMSWLIYLLHGHLKGAECSKLQISVCSARIVFVSISMQGSSGLRVIHRLAQWQCDQWWHDMYDFVFLLQMRINSSKTIIFTNDSAEWWSIFNKHNYIFHSPECVYMAHEQQVNSIKYNVPTALSHTSHSI